MSFFSGLFYAILYKPIFNLLILFYKYLPGNDFGIAIIILTILIKAVLYPLGSKAIRSQKALSELQPKMKEIQERYKNDKEKQVKAMMELYQKEKINPFSGFLPILIQLPILFALYRVFWKGMEPDVLSSFLYNSPVFHIDKINQSFLGIINLGHSTSFGGQLIWANVILVILVGILQFIQMKMVMPKIKKTPKAKGDNLGQVSNMMQKQMVYFLPIFTVFILWRLPAALGLYWLVTNLFSIAQQYFIFKKKATQNQL